MFRRTHALCEHNARSIAEIVSDTNVYTQTIIHRNNEKIIIAMDSGFWKTVNGLRQNDINLNEIQDV